MQKKLKIKLFSCCMICGLISGISLFKVNASGIFSSSNYCLPQGKDMSLSPYRYIRNDIKWNSSNPNVASVDAHGVVHAKSCGSTEISAIKNKENSKCVLNVTEAEPIRCVYTSLPKEHENVHLYAVTPKSASCVKFEISNSNFRKEIYSNSKSIRNDYYLWQESISPLECGTYNLAAYSYINGQWKECSNSYISFTVSCNHTNRAVVSNSRKNLSKEGVSFIIGCEGFVPHVYKDIANILTIGYGKIIYSYRPFYNNLSKEEGYQDFLNAIDRSGYISSVNDFLAGNNIKFNQYQFDALTSFTYNTGTAWMKSGRLRDLILQSKNGGNYGTVNSSNGLCIRSQPNASARRLGVLRNRDRVSLISMEKKNGNWYHIKTSRGTVGYCYGEFLNVCSSGEKSLNDINRSEFIKTFLQYHHARPNGIKKCFKGLLRRRIKELEIFFNGNYTKLVPFSKYPIPGCIKI